MAVCLTGRPNVNQQRRKLLRLSWHPPKRARAARALPLAHPSFFRPLPFQRSPLLRRMRNHCEPARLAGLGRKQFNDCKTVFCDYSISHRETRPRSVSSSPISSVSTMPTPATDPSPNLMTNLLVLSPRIRCAGKPNVRILLASRFSICCAIR